MRIAVMKRWPLLILALLPLLAVLPSAAQQPVKLALVSAS